MGKRYTIELSVELAAEYLWRLYNARLKDDNGQVIELLDDSVPCAATVVYKDLSIEEVRLLWTIFAFAWGMKAPIPDLSPWVDEDPLLIELDNELMSLRDSVDS